MTAAVCEQRNSTSSCILLKLLSVERSCFLSLPNPFEALSKDQNLSSIECFIQCHIDGFTRHHLFIYMPTFRIPNYPRSSGLVLGIFAVGASTNLESFVH
jgi:hypothetical protein